MGLLWILPTGTSCSMPVSCVTCLRRFSAGPVPYNSSHGPDLTPGVSRPVSRPWPRNPSHGPVGVLAYASAWTPRWCPGGGRCWITVCQGWPGVGPTWPTVAEFGQFPLIWGGVCALPDLARFDRLRTRTGQNSTAVYPTRPELANIGPTLGDLLGHMWPSSAKFGKARTDSPKYCERSSEQQLVFSDMCGHVQRSCFNSYPYLFTLPPRLDCFIGCV